jgi:Cobalt transport protein.
MIEELYAIEQESYRDSIVHRLDARVKLIITFAAIIAVVSFPFEENLYLVSGGFLFLLLILFTLSQTSLRTYLIRLAMILPFGFFIIVAQIFFKNPAIQNSPSFSISRLGLPYTRNHSFLP